MNQHEAPFQIVKPLIAYKIGENVYRLKDYSLAIVDPTTNQALIITQHVQKKRDKE